MIGFATVGWLGAFKGVDYACAGQDSVLQGRDSTVTAETNAAPPPTATSEVSAKIAALLETAEQQIANGREWSPPNDNASDTFVSMLAILPNASISDMKIIQDIPSRFTKRAGAAIAAGRYKEAQVFLSWARNFSTVPPDDGIDPVEQVPLNAPGADIAAPLSRAIPPGAEVKLLPPKPNEAAAHEAGKRESAGTGDRKIRHPPAGVSSVVRPRPASSALVRRDVAKAADEHCRAVVLKVQLGEEPSNADRAYLRQGCHQG